MKKILTSATLIIGMLLGASALSAAAAGTWSAPLHTPPTCLAGEPGCDAPINVGSMDQVKDAGLALTKLLVSGQVQIQDGTEGMGKVLTSDASGKASWQTSSGSSGGIGDNCDLLGTSPLNPLSGVGPWYKVNVPLVCQNGNCGLVMAVRDTTGAVSSLKTTSLIELTDTLRVSKNGNAGYWWAEVGGNSGRNGTTAGSDTIMEAAGNSIGLYDDNNAAESNHDQWSLKDNSNNFSVDLYVCK